ncbi:MAG: hypothetical protein PQJ59_12535 [Spirochaetales bacterium]|nr:hypothetical protein [Spirochaetales bacterium]
MNSHNWISLQNDMIQMEFWKGLSHFLNDRELSHIMARLEQGKTLYQCHRDEGVLEKYQLEVFKLIQTLSRRYPDDTVNPIL